LPSYAYNLSDKKSPSSVKRPLGNEQTGKKQMIRVKVVSVEHLVLSNISQSSTRRFQHANTEAKVCLC
jgi:hypothetical protein